MKEEVQKTYKQRSWNDIFVTKEEINESFLGNSSQENTAINC